MLHLQGLTRARRKQSIGELRALWLAMTKKDVMSA